MKKLLSLLIVLWASVSGAQIVNTEGSFIAAGGTLSGCSIYSFVYVDVNGNLACALTPVNGSVSTAGRSILTIRDSITGSSTTSNFLNITGTNATTLTAESNAVVLSITGAGSSSQPVTGLNASLLAGYTGTSPTAAGRFANTSAVANVTDPMSTDIAGNVGISASSLANAAGYMIGGLFRATNTNGSGGSFGVIGYNGSGGAVGAGVYGQSVGTSNGAGGFFRLGSTIASTNFSPVALVADNGSVAAKIFEARDNGTAVLTVADGGTTTFAIDTRLFVGVAGLGGGGLVGNSVLTPDAPSFLTGSTSNSWHLFENGDFTGFDFNNGACGTSACTDPGLIIHSAAQDTTQYNHNAVWGTAGGALKTLTESAATSVVRIPVAALEGTGGKLTYRVKAADATDVQIREGEIKFAVVNKAGTETCTLSGASEAADGSVVAASVGTLTYGITCDTTPANAVDIQFNAVSSLTQTTLNIQYFVTLTGVGQPARQ